MSHIYHNDLPGYHEDQVLHDGCPECEHRSASVDIALSYLDAQNFDRAWRRAAEWRIDGLDNLSHAEMPLLDALWGVQIQLQRRCGLPVGQMPGEGL